MNVLLDDHNIIRSNLCLHRLSIQTTMNYNREIMTNNNTIASGSSTALSCFISSLLEESFTVKADGSDVKQEDQEIR